MDNDDLVHRLRNGYHSLSGRPVVEEAADEIERLTGIVLCLTRRWPDCNAKDCGQACMPKQVTA